MENNMGGWKAGILSIGTCLVLGCQASLPADYKGTPFDLEAYKAQQQEELARPQTPQAFTAVRVLWDANSASVGTGWVRKGEPTASIGLTDDQRADRKFIRFRKTGSGQFTSFGWQWASPSEPPIDLGAFDAISFVMQITGPQKLQELYFGVDEYNPTPVSLRKYDPAFDDGAWHTVTIPIGDLKWSPYFPVADRASVRGVRFMTYLWQKSDFEVHLDRITVDRASGTAVAARSAICPATQPAAISRGQAIPGRLECAYYDLGGEGVAYHDTDPINVLSGVLNQQKQHQRPDSSPLYWNFRKDEGVDISYTKDFADFNHHQNMVVPPVNQLYIGSASDGECCNYTVDVKKAGTYRIIALYGNDANAFTFSINHQPAADCKFPVKTGSMHKWNKAQVGTITFAKAGRQLLTLHYNHGNNFAYFDFEN
jgi:hypothetical protein